MPVSLSFPTSSSLMFWKKRSVTITEYDPTYKVLYLGNISTPWAKGEGCTEKPLSTLWKAYCAFAATKPHLFLPMEMTVCNSGIKSVTKEHSLTEYWAYRVTYCCAPKEYPGVFCWIYRHDRSKMTHDLRCHAALCVKPEQAKELTAQLNDRLAFALQEFRREKLTRQKARLSLANSCYDCPSMPRRKLLLYRGTINFRPPLEMSKIAPKLTDIEEDLEEDLHSAIIVPGEDEDSNGHNSLSLCSSYSLDSESSTSEEDVIPRYKMLCSSNSIGECSGSDDEISCDSTESSEDSEAVLKSFLNLT